MTGKANGCVRPRDFCPSEEGVELPGETMRKAEIARCQVWAAVHGPIYRNREFCPMRHQGLDVKPVARNLL